MMAVFRLGRIHGSGLPRRRAVNSSRPGTTRTDYRHAPQRAVMFDLERSTSDIAQTSAVLFSRNGTAAAFTGSACPPIVSTFTAKRLGHWRGTMVTLSGTSRPVPLRSASTTRLSAPEHHSVLPGSRLQSSTRVNKNSSGRGRLSAVSNGRQGSSDYFSDL